MKEPFKFLKLFLALFTFISLNGCGTSDSSEIKIEDNIIVEPTQMIVNTDLYINDNSFGSDPEETAGWIRALLVIKVTNNGEKKYSFDGADFVIANENGEIPGAITVNNIEIFSDKTDYLIVDLDVRNDAPSEQLGVMYNNIKILVEASSKIVEDPMVFSFKQEGNIIKAENEELILNAEFIYDDKNIESISYTIQNKTKEPVLVPAFNVDVMYADDIFNLVNQQEFKENDFLTMLNQGEEITLEEMNQYKEKLKTLGIYTDSSSCRLTQSFILTESQESNFEYLNIYSPIIYTDLTYSYSMY